MVQFWTLGRDEGNKEDGEVMVDYRYSITCLQFLFITTRKFLKSFSRLSRTYKGRTFNAAVCQCAVMSDVFKELLHETLQDVTYIVEQICKQLSSFIA